MSDLKSEPPLADSLLLRAELDLEGSMDDSRRLRILVDADVDEESVDLPQGKLLARSARVSRLDRSLVLRRRVDAELKSLLPRPTLTPLPHSRKISVN